MSRLMSPIQLVNIVSYAITHGIMMDLIELQNWKEFNTYFLGIGSESLMN